MVKAWSFRRAFAFEWDGSFQESRPQFENRIMVQVYVRSITRSTMYQKAPFC